MNWISDNNGNKCSVAYFGSQEAAQKALDGLKDCTDCINCSRCSDCSGCSGCSGCSRCSRCSDLKGKEANSPRLAIPADLDAKVYAAASAPGALDMKDWHTCEKTHCRAGWIVALAGAEGKKVESFFNTELAAMLIYRESTGRRINPGRFFDENDAALEDMRKLAEASA